MTTSVALVPLVQLETLKPGKLFYFDNAIWVRTGIQGDVGFICYQLIIDMNTSHYPGVCVSPTRTTEQMDFDQLTLVAPVTADFYMSEACIARTWK